MFNKNTSDQSEPEPTDIEKRVDAYMDPERPAPKAEKPKRSTKVAVTDGGSSSNASSSPVLASAPVLPPLDIFEGQPEPTDGISGAPEVKEPKKAAKTAQEKAADDTVEPAAPEAEAADEPVEQETTADEPVEDVPAESAEPKEESVASSADTSSAVVKDDSVTASKDSERPKPIEKPAQDAPPHRNLAQRIGHVFAAWWHNKPARYATLLLIFIALLTAGVVPSSRYYVLNTAGVRAATSITIMDRTTQLPLKNVAVTVGDTSGKTDQDGWVRLDGVKLGTQQLKIERLGFAVVDRTVTLGLGSNPLGEEQLKAVGTQYTIALTDFLSGKPIQDAEASSGEATAVSDDDGKIILTLGQIETPEVTIAVKAPGYRSEKMRIDATDKKAQKLTLVTRQKNVYISKQSGKYDVYQIDIDGKNKKLLLAGTGRENQQLSVVQHPEKQLAAVVSSRDDKQNQDGFPLKTLTVVSDGDEEPLSLDTSEDIRIVDWTEDKLVYVKIKAGTSAGNPERYQLMSYDADTTINTQLASANYFTDIVSAKGSVYYAATNNYQGGKSQFSRVNPNNGNKQVLYSGVIWNIYRTRYDTLMLNNQEGWFTYTLGNNDVKKADATPSNANESRFYLDALNEKRSLWTENRDGKGILLSYDADTRKDTVITSQSGLTYPLKWLNDEVVVYRVVTPGEIADYAVSIKGGEPRKIVDVTNTSGFGRWFYY